jgi:hypothetical protein
MADPKSDALVMKLASAEKNRMKELVVAYLNDEKSELELEAVAILPITQNMFNNVVTALRSEHPMEVIYQLDVSHDRDVLNSKVRSDQGLLRAELVPPFCYVSLPRNRRQNCSSRSTHQSESQERDPYRRWHQDGTYDKASPYRFKQRFSFVLEEMGCRVDVRLSTG